MKYFSIAELTRSSTASARNIDNTPADKHIQALVRLTENVLDPLREAFGAPVYIGSGYRSPRLNRAVGGVPMSQHTKGEAADINTGSREGNERLFRLALELDLPFDQMIDEYEFGWIHISHKASGNRRNVIHTKKNNL